MQSLNSQPTFGEMLDKAALAQFNQGAEKTLALSGVKVKPTTARKKLACGNEVSVPADVLVSDWISGSSVLGPVKLHKTECLTEMGYFPLCSEMVNGNWSEESSRESDLDGDEKEDLLSHGFYEVDDIVE